MNIDREYLKGLLESMRQQEEAGLKQWQQAHGAIIVLEALLARLDEAPPADAPPTESEG
jgi:hypothetical protein